MSSGATVHRVREAKTRSRLNPSCFLKSPVNATLFSGYFETNVNLNYSVVLCVNRRNFQQDTSETYPIRF